MLEKFHHAVSGWFGKTFAAPTECQTRAWPAIKAGRHTLIAAPTGSGKTLAAFLAAIDELVRKGTAEGLIDETQVVYVSPLKALSNDIQRNLEQPLDGIREELKIQGYPEVEVRALVRTGDTPSGVRASMRRRPPHIVVTTPESLYILLTSESGRRILATTRTVIVDEIHAIVGNKRGAHLSLTLERLEALTGPDLVRIGLSATQRPIEEVARFLVGGEELSADGMPQCTIVDLGHRRQWDLAIEVPRSPLEAVMSGEVWEEVYDRLTELILAHRTTLVFVNTRSMAERVTRHLSERMGEENVTSHHGSLAREKRLAAEERLKNGDLRALVATASLELGIDIGEVDLVCQLGSPRSIATLLQRVGRSGHAVGGRPKGRLFPLSRDGLVECAALLEAVQRGELDRLMIPQKPLDVLAQQIVAEVACQEWEEDSLYDLVQRAYPYRNLARDDFLSVIRMLAEGFSFRRGRRGAYLHRDAVNRRLRGRRGARLAAITSGGTIPDTGEYDVVLEPTGTFIGTVNEDFAMESVAGDIFQLGNNSYRILRVEASRVRVEDAHGQPPNIPFWLGEAPARTDELSKAVSRFREEVADFLEGGEALTGAQASPRESAMRWLVGEIGVAEEAADQIVEYLGAAQAVLGTMPSQNNILLERFFDESGGMQLIVHSPFGSRINRAWGLALRKCFFSKFNVDVQAAATEDAIVLSLTSAYSFALGEVASYLRSNTVRQLLVQALQDTPMFIVRWRWNATVALAVLRFRGGKKVPSRLQRMDAEDLFGVVCPDRVIYFEQLAEDGQSREHPLVIQTLRDCLEDAMDVHGLEALLAEAERGERRFVARDILEPSPLAQEILTARPYAYLDDAPMEERRTLAVRSRRWLDPETAADLGRLDPQAVDRVEQEAWPEAQSADELHDALVLLGFLTELEGLRGGGEASARSFESTASHESSTTPSTEYQERGWRHLMDALTEERRATTLRTTEHGPTLWIAAERLPQFQAIFPQAALEPPISAPREFAALTWSRKEALVEIVRGRLEGLGPTTGMALARSLDLPVTELETALSALESQGFVLRGSFTPGASETEWCERRLLARIHRYTLDRLRQEIEPVSSADFMRFLFVWHHVAPDQRMEGPQALASVVEKLEGFEAPAAAWEGDILPARLKEYDPAWLDRLCLSGRMIWMRLIPPSPGQYRDPSAGPIRTTPVALLSRKNLTPWNALVDGSGLQRARLSPEAKKLSECLTSVGASFFDDLVEGTGLLRTQVEQALGELVALGLVSADSFSGLRALLIPSDWRRPLSGGKRRRKAPPFGIEDAGRWVRLLRGNDKDSPTPAHGGSAKKEASLSGYPTRWPASDLDPEAIEHVARVLLGRYGVIFRRLLEREAPLIPWRALLHVYRRLEARGDIRGGRFVAGFSGEQYALPEVVGTLRQVRRQPRSGTLISICGADPLNLVGIVTPGAKVPALASSRVLYQDGVPVAILTGGEVRFMAELDPSAQWQMRKALLRRSISPTLRSYLGHAL